MLKEIKTKVDMKMKQVIVEDFDHPNNGIAGGMGGIGRTLRSDLAMGQLSLNHPKDFLDPETSGLAVGVPVCRTNHDCTRKTTVRTPRRVENRESS